MASSLHQALLMAKDPTRTAPDPYWSNVVFLSYMNGPNGSSTFVDETGRHNIATVGLARVDTTYPIFGTGAGHAPDHTANWPVTDRSGTSADFVFPGDYTVEFWVRIVEAPNGGPGILDALAYWGGQYIYTYLPGGTILQSAIPVLLNSWTFVAIQRSGTTVSFWINGINAGSGSFSATVSGFGTIAYSSYYDANAWLSNIRITKGVSRYTVNFTPPTDPFPNH